MKFWAVVFLIATSLVAVLKHEREDCGEEQDPAEQDLGIVDTYRYWYQGR
jgi:hypothetical protein